MLTKRIKWFCAVAFIAVIGFFIISSTAYAGDKSGVNKEGIKVHGHWKIEIFNPDGMLVSTTEFNNSLQNTGQQYLVQLLTGAAVHGAWELIVEDTITTQPCNNSSTPDSCRIGESGVNYGSLNISSSNLVVNSQTYGPITLSGSVTASNASTINRVATGIFKCVSTTTTIDTCRAGILSSVWLFTNANLASPPSVVAGQLIQVTVTISFS